MLGRPNRSLDPTFLGKPRFAAPLRRYVAQSTRWPRPYPATSGMPINIRLKLIGPRNNTGRS